MDARTSSAIIVLDALEQYQEHDITEVNGRFGVEYYADLLQQLRNEIFFSDATTEEIFDLKNSLRKPA